MNAASRWRIELAREIATVYAEAPRVTMIALGGSAARGLADALSDLDMAVYWEGLDVGWVERAALEPYGGRRFTFRTLFDNQIAVEQYFIGDAKVDVAHLALAWWEQSVADVQERGDTAPEKQEVLDGFLSAIPFHGKPAYERWRARIATYPDTLARTMIGQHLAFMPTWVFTEMCLGRGDLPAFYSLLAEMVTNLLGVLAGLNRMYLSTAKLKRSADLLGQMRIAPPGAAERIQALFSGERYAAAADLARLIDETLGLVELHMPEIDTSRARAVQRIEVRPCQAKPRFQHAPAREGEPGPQP